MSHNVLKINDAIELNAATSVSGRLSDLNDIPSSATTNQTLTYNSTNSEFEVSSAGGGGEVVKYHARGTSNKGDGSYNYQENMGVAFLNAGQRYKASDVTAVNSYYGYVPDPNGNFIQSIRLPAGTYLLETQPVVGYNGTLIVQWAHSSYYPNSSGQSHTKFGPKMVLKRTTTSTPDNRGAILRGIATLSTARYVHILVRDTSGTNTLGWSPSQALTITTI